MGNTCCRHKRSFFPSPPTDFGSSSAPSENVHPEEWYFCCCNLIAGATALAHLTFIGSMILLMIAFKVFFMNEEEDEEYHTATSKILALLGASCVIGYAASGRILIQGIQEERPDKLMPWIVTSGFVVIFIFSSVLYIISNYANNPENHAHERGQTAFIMMSSVSLIAFGSFWIYAIWGVILLWRKMTAENAVGNGNV